MLYACLATFSCLLIGLAGLALSLADIERFNFGLYLALLSVVGCTVSIAFWIIAPATCANPLWMQRLMARYSYKFEPVHSFMRRHFGKKRRRKRRRSKGARVSRTSRVLIAFTRVRETTTDEGSKSDEKKSQGRRDTDVSKDTTTLPMENGTTGAEEEQDDETSIEEEADFCPLIASSLASVIAPTLASTRAFAMEQRQKAGRSSELPTVGEQYEGPQTSEPSSEDRIHSTTAYEELEEIDLNDPSEDRDLCTVLNEARDLSGVLSEAQTLRYDLEAKVDPEELVEVVVQSTGTNRRQSEIRSVDDYQQQLLGGIRRSRSACDTIHSLSTGISQYSAAV